MNTVGSATQPYIIYQPKVETQANDAQALTGGRWQKQVGHLVQLFDGPGAEPIGAAPAAAPTANIGAAKPAQDIGDVQAVAGRHGKLLAADKFLKADQYEGIHHTSLQSRNHQPRIEGAPNYREIGEGIHGVGQPTKDGIRSVLAQAGCAPGEKGKAAVWTNLRQEPVVYINGTPYNLRDIKEPLHNEAAAPGRTAAEVNKREQQLKHEVLDEAKKNGGYITLSDEVGKFPDNHIVERKVKIDTIETVQEVYDGLKKEGYNVKYQRIPITDAQKPEDQDLDAMVKSLKDVDPDAPMIFNCHAGEGRTTTAMVVGSLLKRAEHGDTSSVLKDKAVRHDVQEQGHHQPKNYKPIVKSVHDGEQLVESQADADAVIAKYSDVHDLKKAIGSERNKANDANKTPAQQAEARQHAADYLERYHTIVAFDQYVREQGPDFKQDYSHWKKSHPDLDENLNKAVLALVNRTTQDTQMA